MKQKAINYMRCSSTQQSEEGRDSKQRQERNFKRALEKHNLEEDRCCFDRKSAFHRKHVKEGALGQLMKMASEGLLKGKAIVFDDWTRLGRSEGVDTFKNIVPFLDNGVTLIVGPDGGEKFKPDLMGFYEAARKQEEGHSESKRKSDYAKSKYKSRMLKLENNEKTGLNIYPWWIKMEKNQRNICTGSHSIIPERKKIVERIFNLYLSGKSSHQICNLFNTDGTEIPEFLNGKKSNYSRGWYSKRILNVLRDKRTIGFYNDKKNGKSYKCFEPVISDIKFKFVQNKLDSSVKFKGKRGRTTRLFSGLLKCKNCGGTVNLKSTKKSGKEYLYLQCRFPTNPHCGKGGIDFKSFEKSIYQCVPFIPEFISKSESSNLKLQQMHEKSNSLEVTKENIKKVKNLMNDEENKELNPENYIILVKQLSKLEGDKKTKLEELERMQLANTPLTYDGEDLKKLINLLMQNKDDEEIKLQLRENLREAIECIVLDLTKKSYRVNLKNANANVFCIFNQQGKKGTVGYFLHCSTKGKSNLDKNLDTPHIFTFGVPPDVTTIKNSGFEFEFTDLELEHISKPQILLDSKESELINKKQFDSINDFQKPIYEELLIKLL